MDELFTIQYWLMRTLASLPLIGALIVGLIVCQRQRPRRPRVARLLGGAVLCQLIFSTIGQPLLYLSAMAIMGSAVDVSSGVFGRIVAFFLWTLPGSTIQAAIWGVALWAVLGVDDWQDAATET